MFETSKTAEIKLMLIFCVTGMLGLILTPFVSTANAAEGRAAVMNHQDVRKVQETLRSDGYYHGLVDGLMGPQTRAAIRRYQESNHLAATGRLDAQTAGKLGVGSESVGGSFKNAGKSIGRGSMEAGHEMKKGKPIASGKEFGKGMGRGGQHAWKGIKKAVSPATPNGDQKNKRKKENQSNPQ
jgi:peptidoglycan hydrolase-like protein with peptidoglycan-binding domain